ncbi:MAG: hypothetical protein R3Y06_06905 [Faecalibacterium sp.]
MQSQAEYPNGADPVANDTLDLMEYHCANCGAQVVTASATSVATECYYCHSAVIMSHRLLSKDMPKKIVPFKIDRASAAERFDQWLYKKAFVPKNFRDSAQIQGVYLPFWLVDVDGEVMYQGKMTRKEIQPSLFGGMNLYKCFYRIFREGTIHMEDITISALAESKKALVEGIQPFHKDGMEPFTTSYLSGFQAEEKNLEISAVSFKNNEDIKRYAKAKILQDLPARAQHKEKKFTFTPTKQSWEYVLMPVWTLTKFYDGKLHYFAMNAQTGKVCGKIPIDRRALNIAAIRTGIIVGAFVAFCAILLRGFNT